MSEQIMQYKPSQIITNSVQYTEYNLYLHGAIGEADDFMEHFAVFKTANDGDIVRLYVSSEGGRLDTGMEYIRHMKECRAPIIAVLGTTVASMASAIALEANEIEVDDMSTMLIHSFSYGAHGSESSIYNQAVFNKELNERWIRKHYSSFLSEEQLSDVFKGVDILLNSDQILEAWERKVESEQQGCGEAGCESCSEGDFNEINLEEMIDSAVESGVEKALSKILKKYDLVEKEKAPKPARKKIESKLSPTTPKDISEILKEKKDEAKEIFADLVK